MFESITARLDKLELRMSEQELRQSEQEARLSELASSIQDLRILLLPNNPDSIISSEDEACKQTILPLNPSNHPTVERYRKDGQIAVIISKGYGIGWTRGHCLRNSVPLEAHLHEFILLNKDVVAAVLREDRDEAVRICRERFEALGMGKKFQALGEDGLAVEWIDEGVDFRVTEDYGFEGIRLRD